MKVLLKVSSYETLLKESLFHVGAGLNANSMEKIAALKFALCYLYVAL
jgi:hypothetical protein